MTTERRAHPRIKVAWKAKVATSKEGIVSGIIRDATTAGFYLELPIAIQPSETFLMEIYPTFDSNTFPIHLRGQVTYSTVLSENRGHGLGIKIIDIAKNNKLLLGKILKA